MVFTKSMILDAEEFQNATASTSLSVYGTGEADLIERLRAREAAAFDDLVRLYSNDIFVMLYRLTENAEEAADLTQETFMSALRSVHRFRGDARLKTWLFRIAINESRNRFRWWKRRRRDQTISLDSIVGPTEMLVADSIADRSASPEDNALRRERESALRAELINLPVVYREAVILCDVEGMSYDETAAALDVSVGTVKSRISRGRHELRRKLKDF
jgi:RNA polymerase sigma-70 factor, ECF subfamily